MEFKKRKPNRLPSYDYASNGAYFVTVCVKNRSRCLSNVTQTDTDAAVSLTVWGSIVERYIKKIHEKYPTVFADCYAIMPNHVHLILRIERGSGTGDPSPTDGTGTGDPSPTVGTVLGWWKYQTTKEINLLRGGAAPFWQRSYYDHAIRDAKDYEIRRNYVEGNPFRWADDEYFIE